MRPRGKHSAADYKTLKKDAKDIRTDKVLKLKDIGGAIYLSPNKNHAHEKLVKVDELSTIISLSPRYIKQLTLDRVISSIKVSYNVTLYKPSRVIAELEEFYGVDAIRH